MSLSIALDPVRAPGWLRDARFDLTFCLGLAAAGLLGAALMGQRPDLYLIIFLADAWLLGYPHVVATFTRLCFDRASLRRHRFLVLALPLLVLGIVTTVCLVGGIGAIVSVYFCWQWWHTCRQSYGIAKAYERKAGGAASDGVLGNYGFYLLPLWGILHRSSQAPETFLGFDVATLPVPPVAVDIVGAAAVAFVLWWLGRRAVLWYAGRLPVAHTIYMLSHFAIFYAGYLYIDDINQGWVATNIWHTSQYLMFVWLQNANRYRTGIDPAARWLSTLSQPRQAVRYALVCLGLSTAAYLWLLALAGAFEETLLVSVILSQTINFHHFIVDAVIWRRPPKGRRLIFDI